MFFFVLSPRSLSLLSHTVQLTRAVSSMLMSLTLLLLWIILYCALFFVICVCWIIFFCYCVFWVVAYCFFFLQGWWGNRRRANFLNTPSPTEHVCGLHSTSTLYIFFLYYSSYLSHTCTYTPSNIIINAVALTAALTTLRTTCTTCKYK